MTAKREVDRDHLLAIRLPLKNERHPMIRCHRPGIKISVISPRHGNKPSDFFPSTSWLINPFDFPIDFIYFSKISRIQLLLYRIRRNIRFQFLIQCISFSEEDNVGSIWKV